MVIFVDPHDVDFVLSNRPDEFRTEVIAERINEIPYYWIKDPFDNIINTDSYMKRIKDPQRIECRFSLYNCVQYSKFGWMKTASEINPFHTKNFIWMDAGLSRFFEGFDISCEYPSHEGLHHLNDLGGKLLVQCFSNPYPDLFHSDYLSEDYLWDNRSYVMGGMFAGDVSSIKHIKELIDDVLKYMLSNGIANNEQIALGYLIKKYPDFFCELINEYPKYGFYNYHLIHFLGR